MGKSKQEIKKLDDIILGESVKTIDLRKKKKPILEIVLGIVTLIFIGGLIFYGLNLKADIANFYPNIALGTWKNVEKATGQPDLDWEANFEEFNENNSAVFEGGGIKQIFLGGFNGQIPDESDKTEIKQAVLKINWRMGDKIEWYKSQTKQSDLNFIEPSPTILLTPPPENETSTIENNSNSALEQPTASIPNLESPSSSEALPEENINQEQFPPTETIMPIESVTSTESETPAEEPTATPTLSETPTETPAELPTESSTELLTESPTESPTELPTESPAETPTPISLIQFLIRKVWAQEETTPIMSPEEQLTPNGEPTPTVELTPTETLEPTLTFTPSSELEPTPIFEISPTPTETSESNSTSSFESETGNNGEEVPLPSESSVSSSSEPTLEPSTFSTGEATTETSTPTSALAPLFEIKYTFDGQNWQTLAAVDKENFPMESEIPLTDWSQIANLQIVIESTLNTNLEENLIVFLDGTLLEIEYEKQVEETETPVATPYINPEIEALLKILNKDRPITEINLDKEAKHSCSVEPFTLMIKSNEIKSSFIKLNKTSEPAVENLQMGNLPEGIEIFFHKNNSYSIQPNKDENELELKIIALPNIQRGNFTIPIIYESGNSQTICQVNVISL
ncbi:MAG TPA: hypothetical protein PLX48_00450 [Candidatus Paceibacterota bacterium]|nr:hypothetical protein [Candidatus Paceibacterota bacterium]